MGIVEAVETLSGALDSLATVDVGGLGDVELDEGLAALLRLGHRLDAVVLALAGRWDDRVVWMSDGSKSPAARLAREANCARATAARIMRRARQLAAMPATAVALADGEISTDHVDVLASCTARQRAEVFIRDEKMLVDEAKHLRFAETVKVVDYWKQWADAEAGDDGDEPDTEATLTVTAGVGGEVRVDGHLDPLGGAEFRTALDRIADELHAVDHASACARSRSRLRADALVEMARRAMAMPDTARRPRPLITIIVGDQSFARLCELSTGTVIAPGALVPHLRRCDIDTIIFDGPFHAVATSPRRTFTGALRRAVEARDRHCQHPSGCDEPIDRCDVDHIVAWSRGGHTDQHNGRLLCHYHNRIQPQITTPPTRHDPSAPPRPPP